MDYEHFVFMTVTYRSSPKLKKGLSKSTFRIATQNPVSIPEHEVVRESVQKKEIACETTVTRSGQQKERQHFLRRACTGLPSSVSPGTRPSRVTIARSGDLERSDLNETLHQRIKCGVM